MNPLDFQQTQNKYRSWVPGAKDITRDPLYDSVNYAAAGQTSLQFFSTPIGQGTTSAPGATGTKSINDTNMQIAGSLPAGNDFLVECIEIMVLPNGLPVTGTIDPASEVPTFTNDVYSILRNGALEFEISGKTYIKQSPLMCFPPSSRLHSNHALTDSTTASTTQLTAADYASGAGALYKLAPTPLLIDSNTAFSIKLVWAAAVATPSTAVARIFCRLGGVSYRRVQ